MGLFDKMKRWQQNTAEKATNNTEGATKLRKAITTVSILLAFVTVGVIVLSIARAITMSLGMWQFISILAILDLTSISAVPWIERIERKHDVTLSIILLSLIGFCLIMWIVDVFVAFNLVNIVKNEDAAGAIRTLNFLKASLIITLQFLAFSTISNFLVRYRKNYIAYQIITYASNLFVDFYLTLLILTVSISNTNEVVRINQSVAGFIFTRTMITLFALAFVYMILANSIARNMQQRRIRRNAIYRLNEEDNGSLMEERVPDDKDISEAKLLNLKNMLDKGLITEDEYNKKRKDIVDKM